MAVNKVIYNGDTLVDLTSDTISPDTMAAGVTAHAADGTPIVGLLPKVEIDNELSSSSTNPVQNKVINSALGKCAKTNVSNTFSQDQYLPIGNCIRWQRQQLEVGSIGYDEYTGRAAKAKADGDGNIISDTYAKKSDIPDITVDTALSKTSSNAIANKAVKNSLYFYVGNTAPADPIENMVWLNPSELEQTVIDLSSCVKSVNGTQPDGNGNVSIEKVAAADKATADGKGNVIADTYSTKSQAQSDMTTLQSSLEAKITALSNELATYKSTVSDLLLKLRKMAYPVSLETSELSKLTSAAVGSGSIYLSQSWRNFDGLLIEYTDDSSRYSMTCYLSTWEHERRIANALALGVNSYGLFYGNIYWFCNPSTSTNTTLTNVTENCKIQAIYGVKLKAVS